MQDLNYILKIFSELIALFVGDNTIIGGSHALLLHGLQMSRRPNDLDIIVYSPTTKQIETFQALKVFDIIKTRNLDPEYLADVKKFRTLKFKKDNHILNIVLEWNEETPKDLLIATVRERSWYIQSVQNIVQAKCSYSFTRQVDEMQHYARKKDFADLIDLKNSNFNIFEDIQNSNTCSQLKP